MLPSPGHMVCADVMMGLIMQSPQLKKNAAAMTTVNHSHPKKITLPQSTASHCHDNHQSKPFQKILPIAMTTASCLYLPQPVSVIYTTQHCSSAAAVSSPHTTCHQWGAETEERRGEERREERKGGREEEGEGRRERREGREEERRERDKMKGEEKRDEMRGEERREKRRERDERKGEERRERRGGRGEER